MSDYVKENYLTLNFWQKFTKKIVFLDFETTGINFDSDRIIEIGAFELHGNQLAGEYQTLINPAMPLAPVITSLTGITNEMLAQAPDISTQKEKFSALIDDAIIIAHNASFEKNFIEKFFPEAKPADFIDSCEVAMLVMPALKYFNLEKILNVFNIKESEDHRALADAKDTFYALNHIVSYAICECSKDHIELLYKESAQCTSESTAEFFKILNGIYKTKKNNKAKKLKHSTFKNQDQQYFHFAPEPDLCDSLESLLQSLNEKKPAANQDYIVQSSFVNNVISAFSSSKCQIIELPPQMNRIDCILHASALHAKRSRENVFIIESQQSAIDDIVKNHIPVATNAFGNEIKFGALKDPENYLCGYNFELLEKNSASVEDKLFLLYIKCYLKAQLDGNLENVAPFLTNKYPRLKEHLEFIKSSSVYCRQDNCPHGKNCYFKKAKYDFSSSDVIITSMATYFKWKETACGMKIEKTPNILMDQAHRIEETVAESLSSRFNRSEIISVLDEFYDFYSKISNGSGDEHLVNCLRSAEHCKNAAGDFYDCLRAIVDQMSPNGEPARSGASGAIVLNKLIEESGMHEIFFEKLINVSINFKQAARCLEKILTNNAGDDNTFEAGGNAEIIFKTSKFLKNIQKYDRFILSIIQSSDGCFVSYLKFDNFKQDWFLHADAVDTGKILNKNIFNGAKSLVFVSSALSVNNGYEYIKWTLGLHKHRRLEIVPFSKFSANIELNLLVPREMPIFDIKNTSAFISKLNEIIVKIAKKKPGKTMVLFNSQERMTSVYRLINEPLEKIGVKCFYQRGETLAPKVSDFLKSDLPCVILGSQGLMDFSDLRHESIDTLILEKLPFPFFDEPRIGARKKMAFEQGLDDFEDYMLPKTLLKIKQTVGRIGEKNGGGLLVIADSKLINAKYFKEVTGSLPIYNVYYTFEEYWRDND